VNIELFSKILNLQGRAWRFVSIIFWAEIIYSALIKMRLRKYGKGLRFRLSTVIKGHENIVLGDNFNSAGNLYLYANNNGYLEVGKNCSVNTNVQFGAASGKLIIGDHVLIAPNVVIRAANHGMRKDEPVMHQLHTYGEIMIEDDVWIGANSVITAGVTLGKGTVVGAGSVVTRSTDPYSIVGGVPARKIGERV